MDWFFAPAIIAFLSLYIIDRRWMTESTSRDARKNISQLISFTMFFWPAIICSFLFASADFHKSYIRKLPLPAAARLTGSPERAAIAFYQYENWVAATLVATSLAFLLSYYMLAKYEFSGPLKKSLVLAALSGLAINTACGIQCVAFYFYRI